MAIRHDRFEAIPKTSPIKQTLRDSAAAAPAPAPDLEEEIRVRAYQLFEQRGSEPGRELDDWLQAEAEILNRHSRSRSAA